MPHNDIVALSGVVQHTFAHRFTLEADGTTHLADLGPKGLDAFPLQAGLAVTLEGERRPSEIKVTRIAAEGRAAVDIHHKKPNHAPGHRHEDAPADASTVLDALKREGWTAAGEPRQKPKHFEILGRRAGGAWTELHVGFDGSIRKEKAADAAKWGSLPA